MPPQLQASTASIVGVSQSVFPAVLPVIAFTIMNNSVQLSAPRKVAGPEEEGLVFAH